MRIACQSLLIMELPHFFFQSSWLVLQGSSKYRCTYLNRQCPNVVNKEIEKHQEGGVNWHVVHYLPYCGQAVIQLQRGQLQRLAIHHCLWKKEMTFKNIKSILKCESTWSFGLWFFNITAQIQRITDIYTFYSRNISCVTKFTDEYMGKINLRNRQPW